MLAVQMFINHNSILGWETTVKYDVECFGNCLMCCCRGQSPFTAKMTGPGAVYVQSMSFEKFIKSVSGGPFGN